MASPWSSLTNHFLPHDIRARLSFQSVIMKSLKRIRPDAIRRIMRFTEESQKCELREDSTFQAKSADEMKRSEDQGVGEKSGSLAE
jgi:hypothetical protein